MSEFWVSFSQKRESVTLNVKEQNVQGFRITLRFLQISSPHYYPIRQSQICMVEAYSILSNMYPTIFIFSSFLNSTQYYRATFLLYHELLQWKVGHNLESIKRKDKSVNLASIISHNFNVIAFWVTFSQKRGPVTLNVKEQNLQGCLSTQLAFCQKQFYPYLSRTVWRQVFEMNIITIDNKIDIIINGVLEARKSKNIVPTYPVCNIPVVTNYLFSKKVGTLRSCSYY